MNTQIENIYAEMESLPPAASKYDFALYVYNKVVEYNLFDYDFLVEMSGWCDDNNLEHFAFKFYSLTD